MTTETKRLSSPLQESHSGGRGLWRVIALSLIMMLGAAQAAAQIQISTPAELDNVRNDLTEDYVLTADIDMSTFGTFLPFGGNSGDGFEGTFDGQGFTISNLTVSASGSRVGLFRRIHSTASVTDLHLENITVTATGGSTDHLGTLAAILAGTVTGCTVSGSVSGSMLMGTSNNWLGGMIGLIEATGHVEDSRSSVNVSGVGNTSLNMGGLVGRLIGGTIRNSGSSGSLTYNALVNSSIGGLTGSLVSNGLIENSYSTATITGFPNSTRVGGLVGLALAGGTVRASFAAGSLEGLDPSGGTHGGLVGRMENSFVEDSYSRITLTTPGSSNLGGLVGTQSNSTVTDSYWNLDIHPTSEGGGTGLTTAQMTTVPYAGGVYGGFDFSGDWVADTLGVNNGYPYQPWQEVYTVSYTAGAGGSLSGPASQDVVEGANGSPVTANAEPGFAFVQWSDEVTDNPRTDINITGDATYTAEFEEAIVEITSWADLHDVRNNLSGDYVLNTNLDSSSAGYNDFASATANGNQGWEPIGSPATPFTGTFDGNGNTISGLRINRLSEDDIGLFGVLGSGADIHDLNMSASIFTNAGDRNGALAGATESGSLITNVHVSDHSGGGLRSPAGGLVGDHHGTITGSSATMSDGNVSNAFYGGLVGRSSGNISDSSSSLVYSFEGFRGGMVGEMNGGVIENCVAGGSLTSFSRDVGGFVARMNGGEIRSSRVTSGSAFAFEGNAGGFVGLMTGGLIENSYTVISAEAGAGSEFLPSENSGGFVASMTDGTIRNSYATGDAEGGFGAGSFVGSLSDSATIENSYAMGRAISPAEYLGGFVGDRTGGTITNGFWNRERNVFGMPAVGFGSDAGITGLVTAQMIGSNAPTNMGSFDYDDDWYTVHAGIAIEGETPVSDGSPILRGLPIPPQIEAVGADLVKHTVTYTAGTGGTIAGFTPQTIIDGEDAQEVTAIAGTGYSFTQWSDENTNAARTDTNITGNVSFTAEFESTFIEINSWADLHNVRNDLSADYILMSDLGPGDTDYDTYASGTANSGQGWEPIGSDSDRFTGEFDGNGRVISGLVIDRLPDVDIGLFGAIGGGALLSNIRLEDLSIDGNQNVGGIVGNMRVSTITGSYVSGVVNAGEGNSGSHVGGIVGRIFGASVNTVFVEASSSSASVSGNNFVGGIVGFSSQSGSIIECYSSGVTVSREGAHAGGIAGRFEGSIVRSYATGTNTEGLGASVGGVVGTLASGGSLSDSYSLGDLSGTTRVGGVVGQLINSASVSSTFAVGVPDGSGTQTGGLLGENTSSTPVVASYWNSEINDPALNSVGVGSDDGITGLVTEDMKHPASGLAYVGWDFDTVWNDGSSMLNDGYPYLQWQTETFSLEYAAGPNGSIDTSDEAASRLRILGASSTVTAVPASGFVFVQWSDEVTDNPRTDSNITANVNVTAEFAQGFTLEYSAGPSGSVDGNLNQFVAMNGSGTPVTANAEFGYAFTQWSDEVTDNPRTDLNVTANVNVTAEFELEPIEINSWADLNSMRDNLGLSYVLMTDLGLSDAGYDDYASGDANGGLGWEPIGTPSARFTGEFDGNGRVISGLVIDRISDNDIGFFGATGGGALLSNIHLVDVDVLGNERVGGLVGDMGPSTITSSHVSGSVSAGIASAGYNIGGLVGSTIETGPINTYILSSGSSATIRGFTAVGGIAGRMTSAVLIQECYYTGIFLPRSGQAAGMIAGYVDGRIERSYSGGVMQHTILFPNSIGGVGGLIFPDAVITDSYSVSDIRGWNRTGGLVGYLPTDATISRSFSTGVASSGSVTGEHIGGFIGRNLSSIPVTSSYWNSEVNPTLDGVGDGSSDGVTGLTTEQMKYPASGGAYAGWDFDTVWSDGSSMLNDGYPYLQWQTETISVEYAAGTGGSIDTSDESATRTRIPGANSTVTAVPDSGFRFVQWSDEVTDNPRTDVSINADISVTAEFIQTFTLDYAAGTGGSIDGDDEQVVDINTDGDPVEAIADSGFRFVQWSDESTDNPRTDLNVTANVNVTA
ncbi:MAG: InlB B-repeat-containing protein, partial [Candidatus Sumerlaeia bacterium]|nr:InlB B-repeat-containing protein [Candidatus Sumerlaeia bacterium]